MMARSRTVLLVAALAVALSCTGLTGASVLAEGPERLFLPVRGVMANFERRGHPAGYYSGEMIRGFNEVDSFVGTTIAEEVAIQLDEMRKMGINSVTLTLEAAYEDDPSDLADCWISPALGLTWPQPTEQELAGVASFFDLAYSKGMQVFLVLSNTHMDELPRTNAEAWLGAILGVVKDHPALGLVVFFGDVNTYDADGDGVGDVCGIRAEPPLWAGLHMPVADYLKWAIQFAHSLGIPYRKLTTQASVGGYPPEEQILNHHMEDGHFWNPMVVLRGIFDELEIPEADRTYAMSMYERRKCLYPWGFPCEDLNPHEWARQTAEQVREIVGSNNGARVIAVEMGYLSPLDTRWSPELALESLGWILQAYGFEGGCFWTWVNFWDGDELRREYSMPVKQRGIEFSYNPVKDVLENLYLKGQTDDLTLTPETVAPVFRTVNVSPQVLVNGIAFDVSADLGETHLFVMADLSALDSTRKLPLVLIDRGDGTYVATTTLNVWSESENGIHDVKLSAMDFWSNQAPTVTAQVTLNNPPPELDREPPSDDFDGPALDIDRWEAITTGGAAVAQDGRLVLSIDDDEAFSRATVASRWRLYGDLDVQVEWRLGEGLVSPREAYLDAASVTVEIGGESYVVTRQRFVGWDRIFFLDSVDAYSGDLPTAATSGRYRLIRQGATLWVLIDVGEGWQRLDQKTVSREPARITLGAASVLASTAFTTYFDDFRVNEGRTNGWRTCLPMVLR